MQTSEILLEREKHRDAMLVEAGCDIEVIERDDLEEAEFKLQFSPELLHDDMSDEEKDRAKRELLRDMWRALTRAYGGADYPPVVEPYRPNTLTYRRNKP
jgi:hypothetical protein